MRPRRGRGAGCAELELELELVDRVLCECRIWRCKLGIGMSRCGPVVLLVAAGCCWVLLAVAQRYYRPRYLTVSSGTLPGDVATICRRDLCPAAAVPFMIGVLRVLRCVVSSFVFLH